MKKTLLFAFVLCSVFLKAQTLVDTNKVWNVVDCYNFGPCGTTNYSFGADTTIGIYQYKTLLVDVDSAVFGTGYEPIAVREDTTLKQVFFYDVNGDALAYDFSLNQGDTYTTTIYQCTMLVTVDSVDTVIFLNGESRKRMYVSMSGLSGCFGLSDMEVWIEGIGSLKGLTRLAFYMFIVDVYPNLICFKENDTLKYHDPNYASCFYSSVGLNDLGKNVGIKIYPNPIEDFVTVEMESPMKINSIHVSNALGELLIETNETELDLSQLTKGIYFIRVMTDSGNYEAKVAR